MYKLVDEPYYIQYVLKLSFLFLYVNLGKFGDMSLNRQRTSSFMNVLSTHLETIRSSVVYILSIVNTMLYVRILSIKDLLFWWQLSSKSFNKHMWGIQFDKFNFRLHARQCVNGIFLSKSWMGFFVQKFKLFGFTITVSRTYKSNRHKCQTELHFYPLNEGENVIFIALRN